MMISGIRGSYKNKWLNGFAKLTCLSTFLLIFAGGLVTSTGSGLSVPDWPLSYGTLFPPMVGGIVFEHTHRLIATSVGIFMVVLVFWLKAREARKWVRDLSYFALGAVIIQGVLGGITVLFFLPTPISVAHGVLAQIFFIITIIIAYSQSRERARRESKKENVDSGFLKCALFFMVMIFIQLILGAVMRHTGSGLAIFDFPKMGGYWIPRFNDAMLENINYWRFDYDLDPVRMSQVVIHFAHRLCALLIIYAICVLHILGIKTYRHNKKVINTLYLLDAFIVVQIVLGVFTIWTQKSPILTSAHVVIGAAILGVSMLLFLRASPLSLRGLKHQLIY